MSSRTSPRHEVSARGTLLFWAGFVCLIASAAFLTLGALNKHVAFPTSDSTLSLVLSVTAAALAIGALFA